MSLRTGFESRHHHVHIIGKFGVGVIHVKYAATCFIGLRLLTRTPLERSGTVSMDGAGKIVAGKGLEVAADEGILSRARQLSGLRSHLAAKELRSVSQFQLNPGNDLAKAYCVLGMAIMWGCHEHGI